MRNPRSVSRNITAGNGGVAVHYGGGAQSISNESQARQRWIAWQRFHMDGRGWADIAYTAGFDNWGNVYAGRGLGVRTAAQGTNFGNQNYVAFVWIGGGSERPSKEAYEALNWLVQNARNNGVGLRVRPHSAFSSTACPGNLLRQRSGDMDNRITLPPAPGESVEPGSSRDYITVGDKGSKVTEWQQLLLQWDADALPRFGADGDFGAETATWTINFYDAVGLSAADRSSPRVGDNSFDAIRAAITPPGSVADLEAEVKRLQALVDSLKDDEIAQQQLVKEAKAAVEAAKHDLERAIDKLDSVANKISKAQIELKAAKDELEEEKSKPKPKPPKPEPEPEPEPKPDPEPPHQDRNYVTVGDKGPDVKSWQESLRKWNPAALPRFGADGDFGQETLTWTLRFFDSIGMAVSDRSLPRIGPKSREAIEKALSFTFRHTSLIRQGDNGPAVKEWQEALRRWNSDALPRFGADADFGSETDDWTRRYQRAAGIGVDGIVGPNTRAAMVRTLSGSGSTTLPPPPSFSFRHNILIRRGDNGSAVTEWQNALRRWNSSALPRFGSDGDFGGETEDWTQRFQRAAGISVDGIVGPKTRSAMVRQLTS